MTKKHEVLTSYFNQREAELQKQLGVQTQRLDEVEVDSESVSKKLNMLYDELESYKSQCKSLKQEMEEQVKENSCLIHRIHFKACFLNIIGTKFENPKCSLRKETARKLGNCSTRNSKTDRSSKRNANFKGKTNSG